MVFFLFSFEEIWGGLMLIPTLIWALFDCIFRDFGFAVIFISGIVLALVCGLLQERNKEKNKKEYVVNIEIESLRKRREREKNNKCEDKEIDEEIDKELKKENSEYDDIERLIEILREGNYDTETLIKLRNAEWARFKRELYDLLHIKRKKS